MRLSCLQWLDLVQMDRDRSVLNHPYKAHKDSCPIEHALIGSALGKANRLEFVLKTFVPYSADIVFVHTDSCVLWSSPSLRLVHPCKNLALLALVCRLGQNRSDANANRGWYSVSKVGG
jgi:hypothetical protein